MTLKMCTRFLLVPFAACAMGALSLILQGCDRTPEPSSPASAPAAKSELDKQLDAKLEALGVERKALLRARETVVDQMKAKVDAAKARLKTDDPKLLKAELEKDPEWKSLYERCTDAQTALGEQRKKTADVVREKLTAGKKISK